MNRIRVYDPDYGRMPFRLDEIEHKERVLHVHLRTHVEPQTSLVSALKGIGEDYTQIDWMALPHGALGKRLVETCANFNPTLVFMQLQTAGVLTPEALQHAKTFCPEATFVTWCGDIGRDNGPAYGPSSWYIHELAKAGLDLALYSSWTQVVAHRTRGLDIAAYLQIGYDEDVYYPGEPVEAALHDVVFLGQNYQDSAWQTVPGHDAQLRRDMVSALRETFGARFGLFGSGWKGAAYVTSLDTRQIYTFAKAAVSLSLVSTYDKYSSDRLLRSLACACPTFVKRFYDMQSWGLVDGVNCIVWDTTPELIAKLKAFLNEPNGARRAIGLSGAQLVKRNHTWGVRMHEMLPLVYMTRKTPPRFCSFQPTPGPEV